MKACHEPISWLRLEHYHLGELPPGEHSQIQAHLDSCPRCRAQLAEIVDDARTLPPLPLPSPAQHAQPWYRRLSILLPAVAGPALVAAVALIMLLPPQDSAELPGHRVTIKGGELAISLARQRAGSIQHQPSAYMDGDRIQVRISTPPGEQPWELVVLQQGQAFFPLATGTTPGGNAVVLGAFELSGPGDAAVCVMIGEGRPERALIEAEGAAALPAETACVTLEQSTGGRP
jgi:hypothetical protein